MFDKKFIDHFLAGFLSVFNFGAGGGCRKYSALDASFYLKNACRQVSSAYDDLKK